jgi:hypothetical protein
MLLPDGLNSKPRSHSPVSKLFLPVFIGFLLIFNIAVFWVATGPIMAGYGDFSCFYASALLVREGRGKELYDYSAQSEIEQRLFSHAEIRPRPMVFNHLAYETLIWIPLTYLPYRAAVVVWASINILLLAILSSRLWKYLPGLRHVIPFPFFLHGLLFYPVVIALIQGQDSIILLAVYTAVFISLKKDAKYAPGCLFAVALFKPHLVLPFILIYLLSGQWKRVFAFVGSAIAPVFVSLFITGWRGTMEYAAFLLHSNQGITDPANQLQFSIIPAAMPNLRGLFYLLLAGQMPERTITILIAASSIGLILWSRNVWRVAWRKISIDWGFSLATVITVLISFHLLTHDAVLLLLPALIVANHLVECGGCGLRHQMLKASLILLMFSPLYLLLTASSLTALLAVPVIALAGGLVGEVICMSRLDTMAAD